DLPFGVVAPGEEIADRVGVVPAGVGVGDLALEELVPGELGPGARGGDDRRGRPDRVVGPASAGGRPVASRGKEDLGRITHLWMGPCSGLYRTQCPLSIINSAGAGGPLQGRRDRSTTSRRQAAPITKTSRAASTTSRVTVASPLSARIRATCVSSRSSSRK